jgi:hypothetical protein
LKNTFNLQLLRKDLQATNDDNLQYYLLRAANIVS